MITFIIPTVNRPQLGRAIDSLYAQTSEEWKAIIVYDGIKPSEDYSSNKIKTIQIEKSGITRAHNGQAGLVRNVGISQADTEWVGFLDDDDILDKNYVKLLSKYSNFDLVIFRMDCPRCRSIIPRPHDQRIYMGNVGISFCYKPLLTGQIINFSANNTEEDYKLVIKLINAGYSYTITKEVGYYVRPKCKK